MKTILSAVVCASLLAVAPVKLFAAEADTKKTDQKTDQKTDKTANSKGATKKDDNKDAYKARGR